MAVVMVLCGVLGMSAFAQTDSSNSSQLWGSPQLDASQTQAQGMTGGWSRYFTGQTRCSGRSPEGYTTCVYINGDGALGSYGSVWAYWEWRPGSMGYNSVYFRSYGCGPLFVAYPIVSESDKTFGRIPTNWTVAATGNSWASCGY